MAVTGRDCMSTNADQGAAARITALIIYYASLAAFGFASLAPDARLWGFNWFRYYPWYFGAVVFVLAALLPLLLLRILRPEGGESRASSKLYLVFGGLTTVSFTTAMVIWRGRTQFLGDGHQVLTKLTDSPSVIKPWDNTVWHVQRAVYDLMGGGGESTALSALQFISYACGFLLIVAVIWGATKLFGSLVDRIVFVAVLITGGYMMLFFGYVENYPPFVLFLIAFGVLGLMAARSLISRWWMLIPAVVLCVLHPFGSLIIPALLYLLLRGTSIGNKVKAAGPRGWLLGALVLAAAGLGIAAYLWHTSYFFRFSLVTPVADQFTVEGYTLFSLPHLVDLVNLMIMLLPGIAVVPVVIAVLPGKRFQARPEYVFLILLTGCCAAAVCVFNPRLGMPRDWDLFSFVGVPFALLAAYPMLRDRQVIPASRFVLALVAVLGLVLLVPRVASQIEPDRSIKVFDHFASLDRVKSRNGEYLVQRYLADVGRADEVDLRVRKYGAYAPHEQLAENARRQAHEGRLDEALRTYWRALSYDPTLPYAWANLGVVYRLRGDPDSALICLKISDGLNPFSPSNYRNMAAVYGSLNRMKEAEKYWKLAVNVEPDDIDSRSHLLRLYAEQERWPEFESALALLADNPETPAGVYLEAAKRSLSLGDSGSARVYLETASQRCPDTATWRHFLDRYPSLKNALN